MEVQNKFCVPFALSFIAGITPNQAADAIKSFLVGKCHENAKRYARESKQYAINGENGHAKAYAVYATNAKRMATTNAKRPIKGVRHSDYTHPEFLASIGLKALAEVTRPGMTIKSWARARVHWNDKGSWLISNNGHAMVYRDGVIYDNSTPQGKPYMLHSYANARLKQATLLQVVS